MHFRCRQCEYVFTIGMFEMWMRAIFNRRPSCNCVNWKPTKKSQPHE